MTAFVTLGYNFTSNPLPPAAKEEHKTTAPAQGPKEHTHNSIRKPKCLFLAAKILLGLLVAGLCVTAVIFLTDFFEEKMGHGGFLPHTPCRADGAGAGHGFGVFDSARNGQHGTIQPGEWCKQHPGDCHWVDSQARGRVMDPRISSKSSMLLAPSSGSLFPKWIVLVISVMGLVGV